MIKRFICLVCCFALFLSMVACGTGFGSLAYKDIEESDRPFETLIAENSKYKLQLNKTNMGFVITEIATGEQWSTTPMSDSADEVDEFGMPIKKHPRVESVLSVECKNFNDDETNTYNAYTDAVQGGQITYKTIENGIVINYHFSEAKVMIPLECTLTERGVKFSVNPKEIQESDNKVISISLAPFFCGIKNDSKNSYMFVPSGSGALAGVESKSEQGDLYSAQVYGYDPSIDEVASLSTKEPVRLNVFGAKNGKNGVDNRGVVC